MGVIKLVLIHLVEITVFNDAAHLHIRQREGFRQIFQATRFHDFLLIELAVEIYDRSVRTNRACFKALDTLTAFHEWNIDVCVFAAFFGKNLDPYVVVLTGCIIVTIYLTIEVNRGRTRCLRHTRHL